MSQRKGKQISLQEVHQAIYASSILGQKLHGTPERITDEPNTKTLQAVKHSQESSAFHDALHDYAIFARPTNVSDLADLVHLVNKIIMLCGTHKLSWKVFALTAFLRRYHSKAPEARVEDITDGESVGDGERLIFYATLLAMHRFWLEHRDESEAEQAQMAFEGAACMVRCATRIGGTRDLCAISEHLVTAQLYRKGHVASDEEAPQTFANKLVPAVHDMVAKPLEDTLLDLAIGLAARQLDGDLTLLAQKDQEEHTNDNDEILLSTIHVMLPHSGRGSNSKGAWQRKLANAIAEILIWRRTSVARTDGRFAKAMKTITSLPPTAIDQVHGLVHQLQTTARKKRKLFNDHARQQGFLLTSSYLMDKASLTLRQVRRAKAGDLRLLSKLAAKHRHTRTLCLIAKRNLDPSKATAASSIQDLTSGWLDTTKDYGDDEIAALELTMQTNTVQATLDKLRSASDRTVWITCVGQDENNLVCAVLVAASLKTSRLFLAGEAYDVSTMEKCIELLNEIIINEKFDGAEPVSVEDMLSSKVEKSQDIVVLSSCDLELEEHVLKDMQERGISIRVHSTKRVTSVGKVTLSLNSTIYDRIKAQEPMTLGVMLDCTGSMGHEIDGCKKGALGMIKTFRELAPVAHVNVMGYWDPVNVPSDPQPKSTGYLEVNKENMEVLQQFVSKELRCQGGGDEPEDIPKALECFITDMKKAELSADKGVHLVFFIADAGFRHNENTRVEAALKSLRKLGVIMVMCPVRGWGTLETLVSRMKSSFQGVGQYIELEGVGQLASIAASVTESIRASLFQSSNVISVTASVGSTIDSLQKLAAFQRDHVALKNTAELAKLSPEEAETTEGDEEMETEESVVAAEKKSGEARPAPSKVFAEKKEFGLTSRDRHYLQLSRLPKICQDEVVVAFGGDSLKAVSAQKIAEQLRRENIPLIEVEKVGYPREILELVQNLLAGHGVKRVED